jgi:hypothetical protein
MNRNAKATESRRAIMLVAVAVLAGPLQRVASAQPPPSDLKSVRSFSGQFIAYAARSVTLPPTLLSLATNRTFVQLEPTLATVSCERIKQLLLRELGAADPWRGTIYLVLYPARTEGDTISIISERFKDGWQYRVELPDVLERTRYVRAMVHVLLLELANRTGPTRAVEVPLWLIEGFSQLLLASNEFEIILSLPRTSANGLAFNAALLNARKETLLQQAQKNLRGRPPLTFEDLSWPPGQALAGDADDLYRASALMFVGELLRLPEGRDGLRAMISQLPQYYNWQFAFLGAFRSRFQRPLDIEKWWSLSVTSANGRDPAQAWTPEESWQTLSQAIRPAMPVRTRSNEAPLQVEVSLQKVIREWDPARQTQALNNTLRELGLLYPRIAQEYVGLVQDYGQAIQTYFQQLDRSPSALLYSRRAARRRVVEAAVQQLDALDARREAMRPAPKPPAPSPSPALPAPAP